MNKPFVPSLQEILYRLVGAATEQAHKDPSSNNPGRFPVVVRPETRAFLEAQASYLGGSIAGVAGAILDGVAMSTLGNDGKDGGTGALRSIAERFSILTKEHNLSVPASVEALCDLGFTLSDFASIDNLLLRLSSATLRVVADRFRVNYDWLAGKSDHVTEIAQVYWYKNVAGAANRLMEANQAWREVELTLFIKTGTDPEIFDEEEPVGEQPHFLPLLRLSKELPGGEDLTIYELWEEGRWSYWRCRHHIKLVIYFAERMGIHVNGRSLSSTDYERLLNGKVLPATIVNGTLGRITWHPDDYVTPSSVVAKGQEEWRDIVANLDYKSTFQHFEKLSNE